MENNMDLDISQLPKEMKLLLSFINPACEKSRLNHEKDILTNIDWDYFLELSKHHRVFPILYTNLKKLSLEWIPQDVMDSLQQRYQKNTFKMLYLSGEMEKICRFFSANGIRTLLLKGPALAVDLYDDLSLRTSSDLDMLVPINDLEKVDKLLKSEGYAKDDYIETVLNDWKWRHHHITYFSSETKVKLEIHWRLNPGPAKEPSFQELWDRRRESSITRYPVFLLGKEDLFLFLVSHGARHGWSRLRWLIDIDQLCKKELEWGKLNLFLMQYKALHLGGQALFLSSELLGTPYSENIKPLIEMNSSRKLAKEALFYLEEMVNLHTDPVPVHVAAYHKRHLYSLKSNHQKFLFILSFLYPYSIDAETLPLPRILHFLYFPLRPFLCLWRKTKEMHHNRSFQ